MRFNNRLSKLENRYNPDGVYYVVQFRRDGTCKVFYSGSTRQPDMMTRAEYEAFSRKPENRLLLKTQQDLDDL